MCLIFCLKLHKKITRLFGAVPQPLVSDSIVTGLGCLAASLATPKRRRSPSGSGRAPETRARTSAPSARASAATPSSPPRRRSRTPPPPGACQAWWWCWNQQCGLANSQAARRRTFCGAGRQEWSSRIRGR